MTREEALGVLEIQLGTVDPEEIRRAYLRRVKVVKPEIDPDGFVRLREAYELLREATAGAPTNNPVMTFAPVPRPAPAAGMESEAEDLFGPYRERLRGRPPEERLAIAREALSALPDSAEARRTLLVHLPRSSAEAFQILSEGAARQPEQFLDQLLWFFPSRVPADMVRAAASARSFGRLVLVADAHATQARGDEALDAFREALEVVRDLPGSPRALRMALRPIFSLHAVGLPATANAAYGQLKEKAGLGAMDVRRVDQGTVILFSLADELAQLGPSLPLGLRQVAARAGKDGEFELVATAAGMAAAELSQAELEHWRARILRQAPTLASLFRLDRAARKKARGRGTTLFFAVPVALMLVRLLGEVGSGSSTSSVPASSFSTSAFSSAVVTAASARARVQVACEREPHNPVCRDLPTLVDDLMNDNGPCDRWRTQLDLVKTSSLGVLPSELQLAVRETEIALDRRCPP